MLTGLQALHASRVELYPGLCAALARSLVRVPMLRELQLGSLSSDCPAQELAGSISHLTALTELRVHFQMSTAGRHVPLFQSLAAFSALCSLEAYVAGDTACAGMQAFASSLRRVAALARVKLDYTGDFGNERLQALNVLPDLRAMGSSVGCMRLTSATSPIGKV